MCTQNTEATCFQRAYPGLRTNDEQKLKIETLRLRNSRASHRSGASTEARHIVRNTFSFAHQIKTKLEQPLPILTAKC